MSYRRIYVDNDFAKKLKVLSAENDCTVIDLTKNIDISIRDGKKKKVSGWLRL